MVVKQRDNTCDHPTSGVLEPPRGATHGCRINKIEWLVVELLAHLSLRQWTMMASFTSSSITRSSSRCRSDECFTPHSGWFALRVTLVRLPARRNSHVWLNRAQSL
jgi:hypothetical protein